jgi:hypothetical protein
LPTRLTCRTRSRRARSSSSSETLKPQALRLYHPRGRWSWNPTVSFTDSTSE